MPIEKIVPDTSVIISGILTDLIEKKEIKRASIIIPEFVVEELRAQASRGREIGFKGLDELRAAFADELSRQIPIRPWSELGEDYDSGHLATFHDRFHPWDISASGLILDGTVYLQPCLTRYGEYPYCRYMRYGAFSVTKSMAAAVAMLHLAEKYGEEVFDLKIADYVEIAAQHDGWEDVTFGNALNAAGGIRSIRSASAVHPFSICGGGRPIL